MLRVYADFNCQDEDGKVRLDVAGSLTDLKGVATTIANGTRVILYVPNELEVEANLNFDSNREIWLATPDYATTRHLK
jgi:hypothetical protein